MKNKKQQKQEFTSTAVSMNWDLGEINSFKSEEPKVHEIEDSIDEKKVPEEKIIAKEKSKPEAKKPSVQPEDKLAKKTLDKAINKTDLFIKDAPYKVLLFKTEKSFVEKFSEKSIKLYLRLKLGRKQQNFAYILHLVIHKMKVHYEKMYGKLLEPSETECDFFKNGNTKNKYHVDADQIVNKANISIKTSEEDYKLYFTLMNTRFLNHESKPTRYSINFFFFEVVRFMEEHM